MDSKLQDKDRISGLLVKAGDERKKVAGNLRGLVSLLQEDMTEHSETILFSLIECVKFLPTKSGVYGTLLALLNPANRVFVSQCINGLVNALKNAILQGNLGISCCVLRTLIECVNANCATAESLHGLLVDMLNNSLSAGFEGGEFGLYLVLSSLVNLSPALAVTSNFSDLIHSAIEGGAQFVTPEYIERRDLVSPVAGMPDRLETLVICLQSLRSTEWDSQVLIRPYLMDTVASVLSTSNSEDAHPIGPIGTTYIGKRYIPEVFFETTPFDDERLSLSERWILEELISNTIDSFEKSVGECTKALLRIPVVHPQFEQVLVDVLVSRSLLPSKIPHAFYHSVLHRATVLQESLRQPAIPAAIRYITSCALSTDTQWLLADMISFLIGNNLPLPEGLDESLVKKIGPISIRTQFANSLQPKLLSFPIEDPGMGTPFWDTNAEQYLAMKEIVRIKDGSELEVLAAIKAGEGNYLLFVYALIDNGSRTITHLTRLLDLYGSIITNAATHGFVSSKADGQELVANTLFQFWTNNEFRLEKCLDIFLKNKMIAPMNVVEKGILQDESLLTYNLTRIVIEFLVNRKNQLVVELDERIGTDMYDTVAHELGLAEKELGAVMESLLEKAEPGLKRWIIKTFPSR